MLTLYTPVVQEPPCTRSEFHSSPHKQLPSFIALLPNITCLQWWDIIWDKVRKYRNWSLALFILLPGAAPSGKRTGETLSGAKAWVKPDTAPLKPIKESPNCWDALIACISFINHGFTISWLPYPWQQRIARAVKVQDYKVMVHKGLGSDKGVCGSESGDFRSTSFFFSPLADQRDDSKHRQVPSDLFSLRSVRPSLAGSSALRVLPVVSAEKVIKILRPMKASRSDLWPLRRT